MDFLLERNGVGQPHAPQTQGTKTGVIENGCHQLFSTSELVTNPDFSQSTCGSTSPMSQSRLSRYSRCSTSPMNRSCLSHYSCCSTAAGYSYCSTGHSCYSTVGSHLNDQNCTDRFLGSHDRTRAKVVNMTAMSSASYSYTVMMLRISKRSAKEKRHVQRTHR